MCSHVQKFFETIFIFLFYCLRLSILKGLKNICPHIQICTNYMLHIYANIYYHLFSSGWKPCLICLFFIAAGMVPSPQQRLNKLFCGRSMNMQQCQHSTLSPIKLIFICIFNLHGYLLLIFPWIPYFERLLSTNCIHYITMNLFSHCSILSF